MTILGLSRCVTTANLRNEQEGGRAMPKVSVVVKAGKGIVFFSNAMARESTAEK